MKIFRYILAAFSMYTRIPVPHFENKDEDFEHAIAALPITGVVIAFISCIIDSVLRKRAVNNVARAVVFWLVPVAVTGGFHIDGFMDTIDALRSYAEREKKLEILKDPHTGAFSVISLLTAAGTAFAALLIFIDNSGQNGMMIPALSMIFPASRALAGMTSILMKKAKDDGMLASETKKGGTIDVLLLAICLLASFLLMTFFYNGASGLMCCAVYAVGSATAYAVFTLYYRHLVMKNFGGVTGDTAGYFVVASEVLAAAATALVALLMRPDV